MLKSPMRSPTPYCGVPSKIMATSALVPPMSRLMALATFAALAMNAAPITPDAVPDRIIWMQLPLPCSADITPPLDFVTLSSGTTPTFLSAACREPR